MDDDDLDTGGVDVELTSFGAPIAIVPLLVVDGGVVFLMDGDDILVMF